MVIKHVHLNHSGGFYLYRIHDEKLGTLCNGNGFHPLKNYLNTVFQKRPDAYFDSGPRSSSLKFTTHHDIIEVRGHEVSTLAKYGLLENNNRFRDNHSKVQMYMLENDSATISMEVPLWIQADELEGFTELFGTIQPLTGHIDVLRIDDDKIWIWDYKPNAHKEKYASTQVYFYSLMMSKRTGIPLDKFRCGYFDDKYAFLFKPKADILHKNTRLSGFL